MDRITQLQELIEELESQQSDALDSDNIEYANELWREIDLMSKKLSNAQNKERKDRRDKNSIFESF